MKKRNYIQCGRYALVKVRQLIAANHKVGYVKLYKQLYKDGKLPKKKNGEYMSLGSFAAQYNQVKADIDRTVTDFTISFLYRCTLTDNGKRKADKRFSGLREIAGMTGLLEVTVKDVLILNGDIR